MISSCMNSTCVCHYRCCLCGSVMQPSCFKAPPPSTLHTCLVTPRVPFSQRPHFLRKSSSAPGLPHSPHVHSLTEHPGPSPHQTAQSPHCEAQCGPPPLLRFPRDSVPSAPCYFCRTPSLSAILLHLPCSFILQSPLPILSIVSVAVCVALIRPPVSLPAWLSIWSRGSKTFPTSRTAVFPPRLPSCSAG